MHLSDLPEPLPGTITVRTGCALVYEVTAPTPILLLVKPRACAGQILHEEQFVAGNRVPIKRLADPYGNIIFKTLLVPGLNEYRHDAIFHVPDVPDNAGLGARWIPTDQLPPEVLRYTLPSRYCESDRLAPFAQERFGHLQRGPEQVQAICEWTHHNLEYRYGSGSSFISACDTIERGYGVCRDFAHVMIALCRALDLPARYVAGHMPYFGVAEGDVGVDFHAYCEVYLGGQWHIYDARYNKPHSGRIKIAHGMDAVDAAFATIYGDAVLASFQVWAYQVNHSNVRVGDPVAVSRGSDGSAIMLPEHNLT
jgi:transglutaminase-like putative cysteine protease